MSNFENNLNAIAESMVADIDEWCKQTLSEPMRKHLGASMIGDSCSRKLWYGFRWAKPTDFSSEYKTAGQTLRLLNRGHSEEQHFIKYLEGIGCRFEHTPDEQVRISDCEGHFGGSLDNEGHLPPKFEYVKPVLFEFKTSNESNFSQLKKNGLRRNKPIHFAQMSTYGYKRNLDFGVYVVVNKNTDEIYIELVKLDHELGRMMIDKAMSIITAKPEEPPAKISLSAANLACKWCNFTAICHHGERPVINCRSCVNAAPLANAKWGCKLYNMEIPDDYIEKGCDKHVGIS